MASFRFHLVAGAVALGFGIGSFSSGVQAQGVPRFELDASWPKDLPDKWIVGQLGGVCVDKQDNVYVTNRRDITAEEKETSIAAPPIMKFDPQGNLLASWGDPNAVPGGIHGCVVDSAGNLWVTGNNDGIIQKYDPSGKLLIQIGTRGKFDSEDGTGKSKGLNAAHAQFYNPAGIQVDPANGDVYVADGYGNRRVVVLDAQGKFLRQFGHQANQAETDEGVGGAFNQVVHCITTEQCRPALRLRPPGRPGAGVRQERYVHKELLDQDRHRETTRSARHGMVGRLLARPASRHTCTS